MTRRPGSDAHTARMAGWRLRLFAWLAACEAPEALALGLPPDRVVTLDAVVEMAPARLARAADPRAS